MPRKKRSQKRVRRPRVRTAPKLDRPLTWPDGEESPVSSTALVVAAEDLIERDGTGTDEQWEQLRSQFLDSNPVCHCQAPWDLEVASGECEPPEGEISLIVPRPAYEAALDAGTEPRRHPTGDGLIRETMSIL